MKHFFSSLIILFFATTSFAQDQSYIGSFHAPDSLNAVFGSYILDHYGSNLYTEAKKGNILLYQDEEFRKSISLDDLDKFFMKTERMMIINPANPDDPYDLVDTNIVSWQLPYGWLDIRTSESYVRLMPVPSHVVYIKKDDFERLSYGNLILACLANDTVLFHHGATFGLSVQRHYDRIQWELFLKMKEQPDYLFLYKECNQNYSSSNLPWYLNTVHELCAYRENVQIINPVNPDDPYDLIDSVITTPASVSSFSGFIYAIKSDQKGNSSLYSIGMSCHCRTEYYNPNANTYYVKYSDLEKLIGKDKARFITVNYAWTLTNR